MADRLNAGMPVVFGDGTMQYPFRDWLLRLRAEVEALSGNRNVDGGNPTSVYLPSQIIDGGGPSG